MSDPRFLQTGFDKQLSHLIEECGEVLAAAGKTQRWGVHSVNPLLPPAQQESNLRWLWREMLDAREAINRLEVTIEQEFGWPPEGSPPVQSVGGSAAEGETTEQKASPTPVAEHAELLGALKEPIARLIDPSSWRVMDSYLAETKRKYAGVHGGYDPDAFKHKESLAKAEEILALLPMAGVQLVAAAEALVHALSPIDYDDELLEPDSNAAVSAYYAKPEVKAVLEALAQAQPWAKGEKDSSARAVYEAGGWRSIDSAPKDGTRFLLGAFDPHGTWRQEVCSWETRHCPTIDDDDHEETGFGFPWFQVEPTHWQPLPEAPR